MKTTTNFKDKNNKEIFVDDKVKFKIYGKFFIEKVVKCKNGFIPFCDISQKIGIGNINPKECEIL